MKFPKALSLKKYSRVFTIFLVAVFFVAALLVLPSNKGTVNLQSFNAHASDGDSLRIGGQRVRLWGIDAPELEQTCLKPDGTDWPCGRISRDRLAAWLKNARVECNGTRRDQFGRLLATCLVNGRDISSQMVREGLALSYGAYRPEETMARADKSGLWSGEFVTPRDWRDGQRNEVEPGGILDWLFR